MQISKNEIEHIAALAKLKLTPAESEQFSADLDKILGYFNILRQIDIHNSELRIETEMSRNTLRDDTVTPSLSVSEAIGNAGVTERNMFLVPKVIDK